MKTGLIFIAIATGAFLGIVLVCGGSSFVFYQLVQQEMQSGPYSSYSSHSGPYGSSTSGPYGGNTVTDIDYQLHGPREAHLGEPVRFMVEVTNNSSSTTHEIYSLDLYTEFVDQGTFTTSPAATRTNHSSGGDYAELLFMRPLPPGATEQIEVVFNPTRIGNYTVNIDTCIDSPSNYAERYHPIDILPPDPTATTTPAVP